MPYISRTPPPPYYTVVFEHVEMFGHLVQRASTYEGYLGIEAARNSDGTGVAAVYWKDLASIDAWAKDPEHQVAKRKGRAYGRPDN